VNTDSSVSSVVETITQPELIGQFQTFQTK
jgi:hypothetical protein